MSKSLARVVAALKSAGIASVPVEAGAEIRTAEAAYVAGETTLIEILDAYRTALEADSQALDLELSARLARIELDLAVGETQP